MLSIKNLKSVRGMENTGWSCDLLLDGKKIGTAIERGMGADVELDIQKPADHKRLHEHCLAAYTAAGKDMDLLPGDFNGYASSFLVECALLPLRRAADEEKQMRSWCKNSIMFQQPGGNPAEWRSIKKKYVPETDRAEMQKRYGADVIILNDRFL